MDIIGQNWEKYLAWQQTQKDPLSDGYPLVEDPKGVLLILLGYLTLIYAGPRLMDHVSKPLSLKTYNKFYNIGQIIFCLYYVINVYRLTEVEPDGVFLMCKRYNAKNPKNQKLGHFLYLNLVARLTELSETGVHILRKKSRNLSYLHVIHHTMNVMLAWTGIRFAVGGTGLTVCLVNFSVHLIMYSYYLGISDGSPGVKKTFLRFKKYLTIIQMVQFVWLVIIVLQDIFHYKGCGHFPKDYIDYLSLAVIVVDLILFINFYRQNYSQKSKEN